MVALVKMFRAADGQVFTSEKEAVKHENKVVIEAGVNKLLEGQGLQTAVISRGEGEDIFVSQWLFDNADAIIAALSATPAPKARKPRVPRASKVVPDPAQTPVPAAVEKAAIVTLETADKVLEKVVEEGLATKDETKSDTNMTADELLASLK